eukprot:scaffold1525_cov142-Cylindrotheca_fusiformis.AAC.93
MRMMIHFAFFLFWSVVTLSSNESLAFHPNHFQSCWTKTRIGKSTSSSLYMAKAAKKKKKKGLTSGGGSLKGFGSPTSAKASDVDLDRSLEARRFYDFLEAGEAGDNLKRCGLAYFPLGDDIKIRGVVAMKPIRKGDVIIRIPYELAANLGQEGADPTGPAVVFLKDYCEVLGGKEDKPARKAYYSMLPPFRGDDCMGSTDFFPDAALEALQAPLIVEETLERRKLTSLRFQRDIDESFPSWIDGTPVTEEHLRWAVWIITSRVLTVQGAESDGKSYRLLIPFLDMCNHDRSSPHVLTGRAVQGGELKVVAGSSVKEGEQINICYGGGQAGNSRMIQDYGFLENDEDKAYVMDAQQLLGKRRVVEGVGAGRLMAQVDQEKTLDQLRSTTMEEDTVALEKETELAMRTAISYRIGVKQALSKFIIL